MRVASLGRGATSGLSTTRDSSLSEVIFLISGANPTLALGLNHPMLEGAENLLDRVQFENSPGGPKTRMPPADGIYCT